jgi:hypothetical protein
LEQTVTQEEIEEYLKKAEEIQAKLDSEEYIEDEEYLIYKEETNNLQCLRGYRTSYQ